MVEAQTLQDSSPAESEQAAFRERGYGFLAWLFLEGPDIPFLHRMSEADVASSVASLADGGGTHPMVIAGLQEMQGWLASQAHLPLDQVRQELARLFLCLDFNLFHDPGLGEAAVEFTVYLDVTERLGKEYDEVIQDLIIPSSIRARMNCLKEGQ